MKIILVHGLGQTLADWNKTIDCMKVDMDYVCPNLSDMLKDKKVGYPRRVNSLILIATQYVMPKKLLAF